MLFCVKLPLNYIICLNTRRQHQHGRQHDTENILKKIKITIKLIILTIKCMWKESSSGLWAALQGLLNRFWRPFNETTSAMWLLSVSSSQFRIFIYISFVFDLEVNLLNWQTSHVSHESLFVSLCSLPYNIFPSHAVETSALHDK